MCLFWCQKLSNWHGEIGRAGYCRTCDFDINFVYILPGWEGSVYNGQVLSFAKDWGFYTLPEKYYLVDAGYAANDPLVLVLY